MKLADLNVNRIGYGAMRVIEDRDIWGPRKDKANEVAFNRAVVQVAGVARMLIDTLETSAEPRNREVEAARARARSAERFKAT